MDIKCKPLQELSGNTVEPQAKKPRLTDNPIATHPVLKFAKLSEHATTPTRGAYDYTVAARGKVLAKTDIQIEVPEGCYGRVAPRSGLAHKHFIDVGAGVIDRDYRGNVGVILFNFGDQEFQVKKGDRIAQLVCERIFIPELREVEKLNDTVRGHGGFGSTGKN